jgi:CheY-like chemotaxis protein
MAVTSTPRAVHTVQFYEHEEYLHQTIARFFAPGFARGEPAVMICRRDTYDAVAALVAPANIRFVDVGDALAAFMDGDLPNPERYSKTSEGLLAHIRREHTQGTIRIYGAMAGTLWQSGKHDGAIQLETLWNEFFGTSDVAVLCGYAIQDFDDANADRLREICRQHTHVVPTEEFADALDDRARGEQIVLLQHIARALNRLSAVEPPSALETPIMPTSMVYVIDDDESVRKSLWRLLAAANVHARTFASAEEFLAELNPSTRGCLIVDVQLIGMTGVELQSRMADAKWTLPVIAMSATHDPRVEQEALRLGATAFLRKPFDPQTLIQAITRALGVRS